MNYLFKSNQISQSFEWDFCKGISMTNATVWSSIFWSCSIFHKYQKTSLMFYWPQRIWCQMMTKNNWIRWVDTMSKVTLIKKKMLTYYGCIKTSWLCTVSTCPQCGSFTQYFILINCKIHSLIVWNYFSYIWPTSWIW